MEFKKQKISRKALDNFALKYTDKTNPNSTSKKREYILANGEQINFIPDDAIQKGWNEYFYLLGQTFPFHERHTGFYKVSDFAFIEDKYGRKVPWTKKSDDVLALIQLGVDCSFIFTEKDKNNKPVVPFLNNVLAVTHEEGIDYGD